MTRERYEALQTYERALCAQGAATLAGVDEAGRGPLAGPVVAACVIWPACGPFPEADDSKKLTPKRREQLYTTITADALAWGVGIVGPEEIDRIHILQATYAAMRQAVEAACARLGGRPDRILVDHVRIPELDDVQLPITYGDALSVSIASASVVAKVTRDRIMCAYDAQYPAYGFAGHKGYGTAAHYAALREYGPCPIHRRSFLQSLPAHGEKKREQE